MKLEELTLACCDDDGCAGSSQLLSLFRLGIDAGCWPSHVLVLFICCACLHFMNIWQSAEKKKARSANSQTHADQSLQNFRLIINWVENHASVQRLCIDHAVKVVSRIHPTISAVIIVVELGDTRLISSA